MGIRNPTCFLGDKLQATNPKMSIPARKPMDAAWKILDNTFDISDPSMDMETTTCCYSN